MSAQSPAPSPSPSPYDTYTSPLATRNASEEMLRLSPATLEKILKLGAQVQRFVRQGEGEPSNNSSSNPVTHAAPAAALLNPSRALCALSLAS